jgi:glycogen synthase
MINSFPLAFNDKIVKVAFNPTVQDMFEKEGLTNIVMIPHGINLDKIPLPSKEEVKEKEALLFALGQPHYYWKGELSFRKCSVGLPRIMASSVSHRRFLKFLRTCLVYVHSCFCEEAFGLLVVEAMASGSAVIAYATAGPKLTVEDGVTGILVPTLDEYKLRIAMEDLINDRDKAIKMGQAGRERAEKLFSLERMCKEYDGLYKQVLGGGQ